MIVYKTTNLLNSKIYVGKDCNNNPRYFGSGKLLLLAVKKYGRVNFKKETLETCDLSNVDEREIYWIDKLKSRDLSIGYNLHRGGLYVPVGKDSSNYGKHLSKSTKLKISKSKLGNKNALGSRRSIEMKKHLSDVHKGVDHRGTNNPCYGKKRTPEQIQRSLDGKKRKQLLTKLTSILDITSFY